MILGYKYNREEIVKMIQEKCERTKDGIYWTPNIVVYLIMKGLADDSKYAYDREDFFEKVYFTQTDFDYFLAKRKKNDLRYKDMKKIDKAFINNNYDTFNLKLKDRVRPYDFNVEELLNNFIYIKYKMFGINN